MTDQRRPTKFQLATRDWRLWTALALIGFWGWRMIALGTGGVLDRSPSPIGLALFATSTLLPAAGLLFFSLIRRVREAAARQTEAATSQAVG